MGLYFNPLTSEFGFTRSTGGGGGGGLATKSGLASGGTFSGSPKKLTITFATPFPNANYAIEIGSAAARSFIFESKTAAGFTINAQANTAFTEEVCWTATATGETTP